MAASSPATLSCHGLITPASHGTTSRRAPMQNAFIENFNGRLRDELLNETLFTSLAQARVALRCWRAEYHDARPHSPLGWKTASAFASPRHPRRDLALRYATSS